MSIFDDVKERSLTVWITGASSGIGKALAYEYGRNNCQLILSGRNQEALASIREQLPSPNSVHIIPLDLETESDFNAVALKAKSCFGGVDVLINNAGVSQRSLVAETDMDIDRKIMEVNYFGNIALTKAILPVLLESEHASIIVVSSLAGKFGFFLRSAYAASKHAIHGFYDSLRLELADNNVHVLIACPSFVQTAISQNALDRYGKSTGELDPRQKEGMSAEECARQIIRAAKSGKHEIVIGTKGRVAVALSKLMPKVFFRILRKQAQR
ncbi:MAG: dehydrogenase/reductase SDR family protein 7B [Litorivivens sp.]